MRRHVKTAALIKLQALQQQAPQLKDQSTDHPGQERRIASGKEGPAPGSCLALNGGHGRYAGEIEQDEEQEAIGRERR